MKAFWLWISRQGRRGPGLVLRGLCMGAANMVPGVSGGTIALITGIYDELVRTVAGIDMEVGRLLLRGRLTAALERANAGFVLPLLGGIMVAIVSLARLISLLLEHYPQPVFGFFTGLIVASALFVGRQVYRWNAARAICLATGVGFGLAAGSLVPVETGANLPQFFLAGMVAVMAMILPGLSGSFLLVIMGKYQQALIAVHERHVDLLAAFGAGGLLGVLLFSRLLKVLLARYHAGTMAFLVGLMLGSVRKVWPFRQVLEIQELGDRVVILRDRWVWPAEYTPEAIATFAMMVVGVLLVPVLERLGRRVWRHQPQAAIPGL